MKKVMSCQAVLVAILEDAVAPGIVTGFAHGFVQGRSSAGSTCSSGMLYQSQTTDVPAASVISMPWIASLYTNGTSSSESAIEQKTKMLVKSPGTSSLIV